MMKHFLKNRYSCILFHKLGGPCPPSPRAFQTMKNKQEKENKKWIFANGNFLYGINIPVIYLII